jgi:hypothetical protein
VPSRAELVQATQPGFLGPTWNPYHGVTQPLVDGPDLERLLAACPATTPGIDGWSDPTRP